MPALSTVLAKKKSIHQTKPPTPSRQITHTVQHLAWEGASAFSLLGNHFLFLVLEWRKAMTLLHNTLNWICKPCCTWSLSIKLFHEITFKRLQHLWAHTLLHPTAPALSASIPSPKKGPSSTLKWQCFPTNLKYFVRCFLLTPHKKRFNQRESTIVSHRNPQHLHRCFSPHLKGLS